MFSGESKENIGKKRIKLKTVAKFSEEMRDPVQFGRTILV